jgi:general secretion pathway protein D
LNTTAKFTIASLALSLSPLTGAVEAASQSMVMQVLWGAASTGQRAASAVKEADELLESARQALNENNFELADSFITRAEKLAPKYGMFHTGATPKKLRAELQKKQAAKPRGSVFGGSDAPQDPFAARQAAGPSPESSASSRDAATVRAATRAGTPAAAPFASPAVGSPYGNDRARPQNDTDSARGSFYSGSQDSGSRLQPRWPAPSTAPEPAQAPRTLSPAQGNAMNRIVPAERLLAEGNGRPQPAAGAPPVDAAGKQQAAELMRQARSALVAGDLAAAEQIVQRAHSLAPDAQFAAAEDRPGVLLSQIQAARARNPQAATPRGNVVRSVYDPGADPTRNVQAGIVGAGPSQSALLAQNTTPPNTSDAARPPEPLPPTAPAGATAAELLEQGRQALSQRDPQRALQLFQEAQKRADQLDPQARASLQMHLQVLSRQQPPAREPVRPGNILGATAENQQALAQRVGADVTRVQLQAKAMQTKEPKRALETLQQMRQNVELLVQLDPSVREQQMHRLDISINETQQYIRANAAQIALDEKNRALENSIDEDGRKRGEIDDRMASMVEEFNRLVDEQRYAEAELVAKRARAMDPENPVVVQLVHTSKVLHRIARAQDIDERKGEGFVDALTAVEESSIPGDFNIRYPAATVWKDLTLTRGQREALGDSHYSERERRIQAALKTPVLLKYNERPLKEVMDDLAKLADINVHIDKEGLAIEGRDYNTPVSINLSQEISLKSALQLILQPMRLNYVIANDVLNITSADWTNNRIITKSYPVGDLVIPIPNFVPDGREGISAALEQGYRRAGYGGPVGGFANAGAPAVMIADNTRANTPVSTSVQAQWLNRPDSPPATGVPQQIGFGAPGGLGGGSQADFDSLIDLITSTIAPTTWDSAGGLGSVAPFETNLTLVVSQTQEVHEQIADLLQQLRRLQDLQVTIEVRFINLNDNFFERIGVDFDFNIDDNFTGPFVPISADNGRSAVIGLDPVVPLTPTANLDLQFRQGSFNATVPNIPGVGFDPAAAGTFGFAILSDIEAFFLIQAAQGDTRSNILQAPKVTLFNGQTAFISDTSQRPFVTSIIPVVGDFAAAQQPVIVVLSEGTSLSVQAIVSNDRRFVRLTLVPFFSQIGDVQEFTFTGSKTTAKKSSDTVKAKGDDETSRDNEETVSQEGTTVQLPTFSFVTVTTTVSVPDGGTVLLGGIKRLNENRTERGLPILSKIPYINRLFKNVGIGRTTQSLMMMVTPRIIIQEEEEVKLIGTPPP